MYWLIFSLLFYIIYKYNRQILNYIKIKKNMKQKIDENELNYYKNLLE
jgi:hypothetical protein